MAQHVHWKKSFNPNYIGEWDFEDGKDMIVKIADVCHEMVESAQGKEEKTLVKFEGGIKPLILNTTNAKRIQKVTGSGYEDEWVGKKLQLYVEPVSAFGTTTMAVRVREFAPGE